jgi:hypothetical protein
MIGSGLSSMVVAYVVTSGLCTSAAVFTSAPFLKRRDRDAIPHLRKDEVLLPFGWRIMVLDAPTATPDD